MSRRRYICLSGGLLTGDLLGGDRRLYTHRPRDRAPSKLDR